jgi:ABC-type multidrug transport system ATPase subunit
VASQLITSPKILFLDEPTSGLDSAASYEVMKFVRDIAKKHKVLVVASIHQPSTTTFELFDKLMLLSKGKVVYNGVVKQLGDYFAGLGYQVSSIHNLQDGPATNMLSPRCLYTPTPPNSQSTS